MISLSQYYEENLYPLQDGVMNILAHSDTDFFLTGGTALSRAYYNHRYSEDLDFTYISQILISMPQSEFEKIIWVNAPTWENFREDINNIVYEMLNG